jgi:DNA polymerase-3 subunit gamma/tau
MGTAPLPGVVDRAGVKTIGPQGADIRVSAYVVLARKWRPAQFSDIVGQGHIVRTLMNAVRAERIHQAYLFTGSRGIGKTSIARIFAKALRCPTAEWASGPDGSSWLRSCGDCSSCREIAAGNSVDVIEIDGASNNGVDAVREIRENAKYLPASGSRKIYIIDEVHMLTTAAFNALLKTLEEPPAHVIFVFATTEPHKIPATILSRCQRFDFRRPSLAQIQSRLQEVTQAEKIPAEPGALALIARAAEGSLRDSMSLLDQVLAFAGERITVGAVRESIGLIEGQLVASLLRGVLARKPLDALAQVEQAYQQGHDLRVLARSLIEFTHAAILAKLGAQTPSAMELSDEEWAELRELSTLRELEELELIFQALHQGLDWIARSPQPKLALDVLLVKCATAEALVRIDGPSEGGAADASGRSGATSARPSASAGGTRADAPSALANESGAGAFAQALRNAASGAPGAMASSARPAVAGSTAVTAAPATARAAPPARSEAPASSDPSPSATPTSAPRFVPGQGDAWEGLIAHVKRTRPLLASILEHAACASYPGQPGASPEDVDILELNFRPEDGYFKEQLMSRAYADQLAALTQEFFGRVARLRVELRATGESLAQRRERETKSREEAARQAAQNHPILAEAKALFGGEMGPIELLGLNEENDA